MPGKIPKDKYINIDTVCNDIDKCIDDFLLENGIDNDYKSLMSLKHSTVVYMMSYINKKLFKADRTLCNNQNSYIDYNNIELLQVLADKFLDICQRFNKSLGLMAFSYFIGCSYSTLSNWLNADSGGELNNSRLLVLKSIQEGHKLQQINLLNDSPVGALAVANNDIETGLEWSKQQAALQASNAVYILPSERADRLKLQPPEE